MRAWEVLVLAGTRPGGITPDGVATHTRMNAGYAYKMLLRLEAHQLVERCREERRWVVSQYGRDLLDREQPYT
jgi:DNA-binding IclR family transcriptional regulator